MKLASVAACGPGSSSAPGPSARPGASLAELEPGEWRRPGRVAERAVVLDARCRGGALRGRRIRRRGRDRPGALDAVGHGAEVVVGRRRRQRHAFARGTRRRPRRTGQHGLQRAPHAASDLPGSPPPLATFPGTVGDEVAGAVRMLLSDDAAGVTGTVVSRDGRSPVTAAERLPHRAGHRRIRGRRAWDRSRLRRGGLGRLDRGPA